VLVFPTVFQMGKFAPKEKQYSTQQIVSALKGVELGLAVANLLRELDIS
jgi:hypothetical protein